MSDTSYSVDIRATSSDVPAAAAQLDRLAGALDVSGAGAVRLAAQLEATNAALASSSAAAASTAAALAAGEASYAANEAAADRAAKGAERLDQQVAALSASMAAMRAKAADSGDMGASYVAAAAKLQRLTAKQGEARARADELSGALTSQASALDGLRDAASAAADEHSALAASAKKLEKDIVKANDAVAKTGKETGGSGNLNELAEAFGKLGGPAGRGAKSILDLGAGMGKLKAGAGLAVGAIAAVVVVVVALAAAMVAGVIAATRWGVALADSARSARLSADALAATDKSMAGIGSTMAKVQAQTGLATDQIAGLAKQLRDAKVSAADMPAALMAVAKAEAALGAGEGAKLVQQLKDGKTTAAALAKEIDSKFGGIVKKRMLGLDKQAETFRRNLGETFGGLQIEGFLTGLSRIVKFFDASTSSGKALKFLFETMFQPVVDAATKALPKVERMLYGVAIGALKMYIALKPAIKAFKELTGAADEGEGSTDWLKVGEYVAYGAAAAFAALGAAVALATAPFWVMNEVASFTVKGLARLASFAGEVGSTIVSALGKIDLSSLGGNIITGLVSGLLGGIPGVVAAMLNLGGAAIAALKSKLQIASPSKVFEGLGADTGDGFVGGIEGSAGAVEGAVSDMVNAPAAAGGGGGSAGLVVEGNTFNFYGVDSPERAAQMVRDALVDLYTGGMSPRQAGG